MAASGEPLIPSGRQTNQAPSDGTSAVLPTPLATPRLADRGADGTWAARYETLDAWRGLAAIGIVLHHAGHVDFGLGTGRVLLFFVISGYCIVASAHSCMRRGMAPAMFFWRRARRIYPPYLLALAFWAATRTLKIMQGGENDLDRSWLTWLQNITMTQWLSLPFHPRAHAAENPTLFVAAFWSLCYEEQFYLVMTLLFGVAVAFRRVRLGLTIGAIAVFAVIWKVYFPTTIRGFFWEYWPGFSMGGLVYYRLCRFTSANAKRAADAGLVLIAALAVWAWASGWRVTDEAPRSSFQELAIAPIFCLLLIATRPLNAALTRSVLVWPLRAIGKITFSLYLIHQFNLVLIQTVAGKILPRGTPWEVFLGVQVLLHIGLATVFYYFCERPFLNRALPDVPPSGTRTEAAHAGAPAAGVGAGVLTRFPLLRRGFASSRAG